MPRVEFAAVGGQLLDEVEVAGDLVAVAVEDERGVVAVLLEDGAHLAAEEVVARFVRLGVLAPHGHLDFEVDAVAVGHAESRGGRAPRVETDVVQSVVLDDAHDTLPFGVADRGVARFREHGVLDGSAQVERTAVEQDVVAALRHFAHAERRRLLMFEGLLSGAGQQRALHGVEVRVEFVPEFRLLSQLEGLLQADLLPVAAHGKFAGKLKPAAVTVNCARPSNGFLVWFSIAISTLTLFVSMSGYSCMSSM